MIAAASLRAFAGAPQIDLRRYTAVFSCQQWPPWWPGMRLRGQGSEGWHSPNTLRERTCAHRAAGIRRTTTSAERHVRTHFVWPSVPKICVIACLLLGLVSECGRPSMSPRAAVAVDLYLGKEAAISPIGRCSGSAMACEAPATSPSTLDQEQRKVYAEGAADEEHALLREVISTIDRHYYDIKNEEGASTSSRAHVYNGMAVDQLRAALDARKLTSREATYKEIRKIVSSLGDKYSRFIPQSEAASLTKYDVSSIGLVLIRQVYSLTHTHTHMKSMTSHGSDWSSFDRTTCMCVRAYVRVCVCVCVRARACVCVCVKSMTSQQGPWSTFDRAMNFWSQRTHIRARRRPQQGSSAGIA